jgi:hypothetical protein
MADTDVAPNDGRRALTLGLIERRRVGMRWPQSAVTKRKTRPGRLLVD